MIESLTLAMHIASAGCDDIVDSASVCKNNFLNGYTHLEETKDISEAVDYL